MERGITFMLFQNFFFRLEHTIFRIISLRGIRFVEHPDYVLDTERWSSRPHVV